MSEVEAISVNRRAAELTAALRRDAAILNLGVARGPRGETLIDAGAKHRGGVDAGLRIAEICMGGLGAVRLAPDSATPRWPWTIAVTSPQPVIACLGSQYAGWSLAHGTGKDAFFALGSGPARALAQKETVLKDIGYRDEADVATLVIESGRPPPPEIVDKVASDCGVTPSALTVIYAPTQSLAGATQVVARVLEVALHKAHELKFPLERIVDGMGAAPLSPPHPDFVTAMGRTNDCDHLRRTRAALCHRAGRRREGSRGGASQSRVARFRRSVRRDFQALQRRFLRHRSHAVQPGRGHRHRDRKRREFSRRRGASQIARCLVRLRRRRVGATVLPFLSSAISAIGTRARWKRRLRPSARASSASILPIASSTRVAQADCRCLSWDRGCLTPCTCARCRPAHLRRSPNAWASCTR